MDGVGSERRKTTNKVQQHWYISYQLEEEGGREGGGKGWEESGKHRVREIERASLLLGLESFGLFLGLLGALSSHALKVSSVA